MYFVLCENRFDFRCNSSFNLLLFLKTLLEGDIEKLKEQAIKEKEDLYRQLQAVQEDLQKEKVKELMNLTIIFLKEIVME